jgi:predicted DCC family thiol-disulfide oxidoreductase YuxK
MRRVPVMCKRFLGLLRREEGGIATYVAQAVLVLAVLSVGVLIIAATSNVGTFISDRIHGFIAANRS